MPKISVIIPTYNRADIVCNSINSVLSQTIDDLEIIVVDDGSKDNTRQVVESINDNRVQYYYKENGGAASARNLGLAKATGEYILFLDSDVTLPSNYLSVMLKGLENNKDFDIVYSPVTLVYPDGNKIKSYKMKEPKQGKLTSDLFVSSFIWPFAILCRSEILANFFFDENCPVSEDSDAILRLSLKAKFGFVDSVEPFHHISPDSLSTNTGVSTMRLLTLERFYFRLGGNAVINKRLAFRKLSHASRKIAKDQSKKGRKTAALKLYLRAIKYWPFDIRLYVDFIKTKMYCRIANSEANWMMPEPLGEPKNSIGYLS